MKGVFRSVFLLMLVCGWQPSYMHSGTSDQSFGDQIPEAPTRFIVSVGDALPEPIGGRVAAIEAFSLNDRGEVAFRARIQGGRSPLGIFLWSEGKISVVVAVGDPTPLGGTFTGFRPEGPMSGLGWSGLGLGPIPLNNARAIAFIGAIEGGSSPSGIFLAKGGRIHKIVAVGEPTPLGGVFDSIAWPVLLNDRDEVVFSAKITGGAAEQGVLVASQGAIRKIVASGELSPAGGRFTKDFFIQDMNASGTIAFTALIAESEVAEPRLGLFLASRGLLSKVVMAGDPYSPHFAFESFGFVKLNDQGDLAFRSLGRLFRVSGGKIELVLTGVGGPLHLSETGRIAFRVGDSTSYPYPILTVGFAESGQVRKVIVNPPPNSEDTKDWFLAVNEADTIVGVLGYLVPSIKGFEGHWILLADGRRASSK